MAFKGHARYFSCTVQRGAIFGALF